MAAATAARRARVRRLLRDTFGLKALRDGQQAVIDRVLDGRDTLAVMPTGAGKSLCYQLPGLMLDGRVLVVSPLIALMKDQCDRLRALGVEAIAVHGAMSADALRETRATVAEGRPGFVFVTPEQMADAAFLETLASRPTALLVVDEAHCIPQWGHDFRPAFLGIGPAGRVLGRPTVLALTATASADTVAEVCAQLNIPADGVITTGTWRENLRLAVELAGDEAGKHERLVRMVASAEGAGLVYCATVKAAEALTRDLELAGESVGCYHGRLPAAERHAVQDAFMAGALRVVVATNAFGLGIDKPDIRFVFHDQMPGSLDAYYQEAGRAGRDGAPAQCTLMYLRADKGVQHWFLAGRYPSAEDLDAIHGALRREGAWTADRLAETLGRPRTKVRAVLALLQQAGVLSVNRTGELVLRRPELVAGELVQLRAAYLRRREQAAQTLERMVGYALSSRCRWRELFDHFGESAPFERCSTCDNCVRLAAVETQAVVPEPPRADEPGMRFEVGDAVRVPRYGRGTVLAANGVSVTVGFSGGREREFLPSFVSPARPLRAAPTVAG